MSLLTALKREIPMPASMFLVLLVSLPLSAGAVHPARMRGNPVVYGLSEPPRLT